jgi:uncharacterized Ntn-hydrolase superfamily protein
MMFTSIRTQTASILFVLAALFSFPVYATWSIIGVDQDTGEIGIAGASCTFDVSGVASLVPKKGAIVVQAASNYFARMEGVKKMQQGGSAGEVLAAMQAEKFHPERQQYGVILLRQEDQPLVYSGKEIKPWSGSKTGDDVAMLGNILVDKEVINQAYAAYEKGRKGTFAHRLMDALKAGEESGGDNRCDQQAARSAFISVYDPETDAITKLSVYGTEKGGKPAVSLLKSRFDRLYQN